MNINAQSQSKLSTTSTQEKPHLFRLSADILEALDVQDVRATYNDMCELGIASDPYEWYCIEVETKFIDNLVLKVAKSKSISAENEAMLKRAQLDGIVWIFEYLVDFENGHHMMGQSVRFKDGRTKDMTEASSKVIGSMSSIAKVMRAFLIGILITKNIEKKIAANSSRSVSPRMQKDAKRYSHTTTIKIGKITESYGSETGAGGLKRPHLRRGHIRAQHFGKGNAETKKIFIRPVFVNADEKWINEQKTYKVTI